MSLISRYLLRQLLVPFTFALAASTGILLLNQVARKFGDLVGKGLPWGVIGEVFVLSLPFIVAVTLPMAVMVAVLYAFSQLAADNEITALRATGVSTLRILRPVALFGVAMMVVTFLFVDQVLPQSNARLRNLWIDIFRKKPTFELREQAINVIPSSPYALRASRIDPQTGALRSVTVYDFSSQNSRRVIHADSGRMGIAPGGTDLSVVLWHGTIHQFKNAEPDKFEITRFTASDFRVVGVLDKLERTGDLVQRGDREMETCEMIARIDSADRDHQRALWDRRRWAERDLRVLLGLPFEVSATWDPAPIVLPRWCGPLLPKVAKPLPPLPPSPPPPLARVVTQPQDVEGIRARIAETRHLGDRFTVEVHKKYALSGACIAFVLMAFPVAVRFPRGGIGLVIGVGLVSYAVYNFGLTAGETFADRGYLSPALSMWAPDLLFTVVGLVGLLIVRKEYGSTRGGDLSDVAESLRRLLPWLGRRSA